MKFQVSLFIAGMLFVACSNSSSSNTTESVDIENIDVIQNEIALQITDSEELLFANLRQLIVLEDGGMLLSDSQQMTIEQFDKDGNHVGNVATGGSGPGELPRGFLLTHNRKDTLLVRQIGKTTRIDLFTRQAPSGLLKYVSSKNVQPDQRPFIFVAPHQSHGYYARFDSQLPNIQSLKSDPAEYRPTYIAYIDAHEKVLEDTLHELKRAFQILEISEDNSSINVISPPPYRYEDRFRSIRGSQQYLIARADSAALYIYNNDHTLNRSIQLRFNTRPITDADLDFIFDEITNNREKKEPLIDDKKPPFINAWASESFIWLQTDISEKGKELVILDMDGNVQGKTYVHYFDSIQHIEDDKIYVLNKDPEAAHSVRIYSISL